MQESPEELPGKALDYDSAEQVLQLAARLLHVTMQELHTTAPTNFATARSLNH